MNRNQFYPLLEVSSLAIHLAWASLEVRRERVEQVQVLVSGSEADATSLRVSCAAGRLLIEQPNLGLTPSLATAGHWLEILVRLPEKWKGTSELSTISGRLHADGLEGPDLEFCTASGALTAHRLRGMNCHLRTVSGEMNVMDAVCDKLTLRTVSGNAALDGCAFSQGNLDTVSGHLVLNLVEPFDLLDVTTVSGNLSLDAPIQAANIRRKAVSGRLRTKSLTLADQGVPITMTTVSGDLEIIGTAE